MKLYLVSYSDSGQKEGTSHHTLTRTTSLKVGVLYRIKKPASQPPAFRILLSTYRKGGGTVLHNIMSSFVCEHIQTMTMRMITGTTNKCWFVEPEGGLGGDKFFARSKHVSLYFVFKLEGQDLVGICKCWKN
jgi:hypothetical protein